MFAAAAHRLGFGRRGSLADANGTGVVGAVELGGLEVVLDGGPVLAVQLEAVRAEVGEPEGTCESAIEKGRFFVLLAGRPVSISAEEPR